jgi:transcriptional regulator with XRE-family HTH domain
MKERDWSDYKLSIQAGLSQSTVANIFKRGTAPTIATLTSICDALGITLGQFFCSGNIVELSDESMELFNNWVTLSSEQRRLFIELIKQMK